MVRFCLNVVKIRPIIQALSTLISFLQEIDVGENVDVEMLLFLHMPKYHSHIGNQGH